MNELITIENSSSISINGATKVVSSTQNQGIVETKENTIIITGSELEVRKLDLENCEVSFIGKITNIKFTSLGGNKVPLLKRLFK